MIKKLFCIILIINFFSFIFCQENILQTNNTNNKKEFSLEDLSNQLKINNSELKILNQEYQQSLIDVKNAKAGLGPTIDLTVSGTYFLNPPIDSIVLNVDDILNSISWPESYSPTQTGQYITLFDGMENTFYSFQLDVTQPIYTWGKLKTAIKLYEKVSEIKLLQISSKEKQLQTELNTRIVSLFYLLQIENLLKTQDELANKLVKISEDAQKNGLLLNQDVLEAKINAQQINIVQQEIKEQFFNLLLSIQKMTGNQNLSLEDINFIPDENKFYEFANQDRKELLEKALDTKQETFTILKNLEQISQFSTQIAQASVYWKPDFALKMSLGYGGSRFPFIEKDWFRQDDYTTNFTVALKTTVWDGGKKLNEIKKNQSKEETANINYTDAELSIKQKLQEQFNIIDLALSKIEYQKLKIETLDSKIKQQEQLFNSGYGSEKDLLQAKIDRNTAEIELVQNKLSLAGACSTAAFICGEKLFF
ncbi:MAG: TolC family protein [Spirochaetaceae bacterium]|nr:TolC family protein [Spirochaetaceae bacterium]